MDRFPQLTVDQIKGLSEFTDHVSPGEQWLSGLTWKHDLIVAVRRASGLIDPTEVERELRDRLDEAERQVQVLQLNSVAMQEQRQRLQTDNQLLQSELTTAQEDAQLSQRAQPGRCMTSWIDCPSIPRSALRTSRRQQDHPCRRPSHGHVAVHRPQPDR